MPKKCTRAQARTLVERFHRSGLSQRAFAEQVDLSKNTLAFWIARERREPQSTGALVPIAQPPIQSADFFEIEVEGIVLRVPRDATTEEWRAIRETWRS